MTTEVKKECSPLDHPFDIEYTCNQKDCPSYFLCNLCYQTHQRVCPGVFGEAIKKLSEPQPGRYQEVSNEKSETPTENTSETISEKTNIAKKSSITTSEEFIAQYDARKLNVAQPISEVFKLEEEIWEDNLKSLQPTRKNLINLIEETFKTWGLEQGRQLRGMSESSQETLSRLKEIQIQVEGMHFDPANLIKNHSSIRKLETEIEPEAKRLVESIRQVMGGWILNQDRINDYQEAVSKFIQAIEFTSLLSKDKLEFKASSLPQAPDDEVQKILKEVETLRNGDLELKGLITNLRQENKTEVEKLTKLIETLTRERDTAQANFTKEKEDRKADIDALTKKNAEIEKQKVDANTALEKERQKNKADLDALTKKKDEAEKQKADANTALEQERENGKTKDATIAKLTQDLNDLKAKVPA